MLYHTSTTMSESIGETAQSDDSSPPPSDEEIMLEAAPSSPPTSEVSLHEELTGEWQEMWACGTEGESVVGTLSLWQDGSKVHGTHISVEGAGPTGPCTVEGGVHGADVTWSFVEWNTDFAGTTDVAQHCITGMCKRRTDGDVWTVRFQRKRAPRTPKVAPQSASLRLAGVQSRYRLPKTSEGEGSPRIRKAPTTTTSQSRRSPTPSRSGSKGPVRARRAPSVTTTLSGRTKSPKPATVPQGPSFMRRAASPRVKRPIAKERVAVPSPTRTNTRNIVNGNVVVSDVGGMPLFMPRGQRDSVAPSSPTSRAASPASGVPLCFPGRLASASLHNARGTLPLHLEPEEVLVLQSYRATAAAKRLKANKKVQMEQALKQLRMLSALSRSAGEEAQQKELVRDEHERREAIGMQMVGMPSSVTQDVAGLRLACSRINNAVLDANTPSQPHPDIRSRALCHNLEEARRVLGDVLPRAADHAPSLKAKLTRTAALLQENHEEVVRLRAFLQSGVLLQCISTKADLIQRRELVNSLRKDE